MSESCEMIFKGNNCINKTKIKTECINKTKIDWKFYLRKTTAKTSIKSGFCFHKECDITFPRRNSIWQNCFFFIAPTFLHRNDIRSSGYWCLLTWFACALVYGCDAGNICKTTMSPVLWSTGQEQKLQLMATISISRKKWC